jgi:hypothetical protein
MELNLESPLPLGETVSIISALLSVEELAVRGKTVDGEWLIYVKSAPVERETVVFLATLLRQKAIAVYDREGNGDVVAREDIPDNEWLGIPFDGRYFYRPRYLPLSEE